jgi:hypothetical protein
MTTKYTFIGCGTFAEACCNENSIDELEQALIDGPDKSDLNNWKLTENEWRENVDLALRWHKQNAHIHQEPIELKQRKLVGGVTPTTRELH